jgi:hypothetical protein
MLILASESASDRFARADYGIYTVGKLLSYAIASAHFQAKLRAALGVRSQGKRLI